MIDFKERLRADLVAVIEERRAAPAPGRRRARWLALPAGAAIAAVIAAVALGPPPASERGDAQPTVIDEISYSIELRPDGVVEIDLRDPAGAGALERKLRELGFRAVVLIGSDGCAEPKPQMAVPANEFIEGIGAHGGLRIRTSLLPPDAYLLVVYPNAKDQYPHDGMSVTMIAAVRTAPTCYRLEPAQFVTGPPPSIGHS